MATNHVEWDQPHEGNLFEFLYKRRSIQVTIAMPEDVNTAETLCEGLRVPREVMGFEHAPGTRVVFGAGSWSSRGDGPGPLGRREPLSGDRLWRPGQRDMPSG